MLSLVDVYESFPTKNDCFSHLETVRWPSGPVCTYCRALRSTPLPVENRHHCNACNTTFSVTAGTIFHHTHLPLQKWFLAVSLVLNATKGIAGRHMARHLKVNKNTACRISMQIQAAMRQPEQRGLLRDIVEIDETYVGGKQRRGGPPQKHKTRRGGPG